MSSQAGPATPCTRNWNSPESVSMVNSASGMDFQ
jgi:hypothetical protein